jgi:hypothetical protein
MARVVFVDKHRRAGLFVSALLADDTDQIRTAQPQLLVLTELIQLLQVLTNHCVSSSRYGCPMLSILAELPKCIKSVLVCKLDIHEHNAL